MTAPRDRRTGGNVSQLLVDLVENHLDPGYAAAARRRAETPDPPRRPRTVAAAALGCLVIGFVLVVAYQHTHRAAPAAEKVHDRLVDRVHTAQREADDLASRATALDAELARAQADALPAANARQLDAAQLAAGLVEVSGPGLTVTLTDPKASTTTSNNGRGGSVPITATSTLTDRDVRSVVNELWHDGAEAIAVNGVRLTPTSAIRFAGQAVLVDFQPITSPYMVDAIGDPDALSVAFAQSSVASRYQTLVGVQGIGFDFTDTQKLTLPAGAAAATHFARSGR